MNNLGRYEFKYIIPCALTQEIMRFIQRARMQPDTHGINASQPGAYPVTSLYFDSPTREDYQDKAGGFLERKKIRIRIYDTALREHTTPIMLERKGKHDMRVSKHRISITHAAYEALRRGFTWQAYALTRDIAPDDATVIFRDIFSDRMRAHVIVTYKRLAFVSPMGDIRCNIDTEISACRETDLRYTRNVTAMLPGKAVLEIKFGTALPWWFGNMIRSLQLERTAFSKYGLGVEALYHYHTIPR